MKKISQEKYKQGSKILQKGGLIAFPTETVFGFGVVYDDEKAYKRLIDVKKRPPAQPFTLMCADPIDIDKYAYIDERARKLIKSFFSHIFLIFFTVISIGPFIWLISTALKSNTENIFAYPPRFIPEHITFQNFIDAWNQVPFMGYIINSTIVTVATIILNLLFASLAAYPLARMEFKGKNFSFFATLATMMVPFQVIMIPLY